jgi:hypothetical protein
MKPHFNVVFATPGKGMLPGYVRSLLKTVKILENENLSWNYMTEYSSLVSHAREKTIGGTGSQDPSNTHPGHGEFTYDKIMWIDSDISWEPIDFFRLYNSDKQIISGCYQIEDNTATVYMEPLGPAMPAKELIKLDKPFKTFGVGFGFLCVKSGVFENMKRPWFSQEEIEVKNKDTGEIEYKFPLMGEDLSWCNKVQKMGMDIWVDPLVRVHHHKQIILDWTNVDVDWSNKLG